MPPFGLPRRTLPRACQRRVHRVHRPHVCLISTYFSRKGLATDTRAIEFGLRGQAFVFPVRKLSTLERKGLTTPAAPVDSDWWHAQVAPAGMRLGRWLDVAHIDVVIVTEQFPANVFDACRAREIRTVFAPHLESLPLVPGSDPPRLPGDVDAVVAKTARTAAVVAPMTSAPVHTFEWSTYWPMEAPTPVHDPVCLYYNIGIGGVHDRRHVPLTMGVLGRLCEQFPGTRVVVKCHPHARKYHPDLGPTHARMEFIEAEHSVDQMIALQREADLTIFPSRFEGLGYPLLESLHCGVPVVAADASPMNEFLTHGENGWLVPCKTIGALKSADIVELDAAAFEAQLTALVSNPEQLAAVKATCTDGLAQRAAAFQAGWRRVVRSLFPRALNVGAGGDPSLAAYNVDIRAISGVDVVARAEHLPFAGGTFERLGAYDVVEHVAQAEGAALVAELVRVLAPGGEMEVRVPDLHALAQKYVSGKLDAGEAALYLYGKQDHAYNFHRAGYDEASLGRLLTELGLTDVRRIRAGQSSKNVLLRARQPGG